MKILEFIKRHLGFSRAGGLFEITESRNEKQYFVFRAPYGDVLLVSQMYKSYRAAMKGANSVVKNCGRKGAFSIQPSSDGRYYFIMRAANHEIIGRSEVYRTQWRARKDIRAIRKYAPLSRIVNAPGVF